MSGIKASFSIANECLNRINRVNAMRKTRTKEWVDLKGNELGDIEMQELTNLSLLRLNQLWLQKNGDCEQIINRPVRGVNEHTKKG